jgi:hypothetical protein
MDVDERKLEIWRHQMIEDIESANLAQITDNQHYQEFEWRRQHKEDQDGYRDREMSEASTATLPQMPQSRESTATMRGISEMPGRRTYLADAMEIDTQVPGQPSSATAKKSTLIVATDFGTTFSSVAFAMREEGRRPRIKMIAHYPDDPRSLQGRPSLEVPTESWYPGAVQPAELGNPMDTGIDINDEEDIDLYGVSDQEEELGGYQLDDVSLKGPGDVDNRPANNASRDFFWGYGIQKLTTPDMDRKQFDRIARSKLLLDTGAYTQQVRNELRPVINRLRRRRIIDQEVDVIAHYLTQLFKHAREQIQDALELPDSTPVEHVLCVPIVWSSQALRKMQLAMERAIQNSNFGKMESLFLVSEPEAAAAYVLGQSDEVNVSIPLDPIHGRFC